VHAVPYLAVAIAEYAPWGQIVVFYILSGFAVGAVIGIIQILSGR